jgi:hypothetical protein
MRILQPTIVPALVGTFCLLIAPQPACAQKPIPTGPEAYAMYVNDELKLIVADPNFDPTGLLGVGTVSPRGQKGVVTFSNLRIRKRDEKPDTGHLLT